MVKLTSNDISRFKSANINYKAKLAKDWGYASVQEVAKEIGYKLHNSNKEPKAVETEDTDALCKYCTTNILSDKNLAPTSVCEGCYCDEARELLSEKMVIETSKVIHNVHILDNSASMSGKKFNNALKGIINEIEELKKIKDIQYIQSFARFQNGAPYFKDSSMLLQTYNVEENIKCNNNTPLYKTINEVLEYLLKATVTEKVLVKIFTDGDDNNSSKQDLPDCISLINKCKERGFTITFVGTKRDVETVTQTLKIDNSNTLVHNNTAKGIKTAFNVTLDSTVAYSKKVVAGEDVKTNFYTKKIVK